MHYNTMFIYLHIFASTIIVLKISLCNTEKTQGFIFIMIYKYYIYISISSLAVFSTSAAVIPE